AGGVQQDLRAEDIGADEGPGVENAPVHVAFGGEVDEHVDPATHSVAHSVAVGDVAVDELVARVVRHGGEIGKVAGVGKAVKVDDLQLRIGFQQVVNEIAADEAAASRYQDRTHEDSFLKP